MHTQSKPPTLRSPSAERVQARRDHEPDVARHLAGRLLAVVFTTVLALVVIAPLAGSGAFRTAVASDSPTVTVTPATGLVSGQAVGVHFSGFADGGVTIRQCRKNPDSNPTKFTTSSNCALQMTGSVASGSGDVQYPVATGTVGSFTCGPGDPCTIGVRGNKAGGGSVVAFAPITFSDPPATTTTSSTTTLPPTTTTTLAPRPVPEDCPAAAGEKITGTGAAGFETAYQRWVRYVCRAPYTLNVDFSPRSSTMGRLEYARRSVDYAVTGTPFSPSELAALQEPIPDDGFGGGTGGKPNPRRRFVYVPIAAGGVAVVYNLWIDGRQVTDLQLSPDTLAGIFNGRVGNLNHELLARDNPHLVKAGQTRIRSMLVNPFARGGQSADTLTLTSWLHSDAAAKAMWQQAGPQFQVGQTETFPAEVGVGSFGAVNLIVQNVRRPDGFEPNTTFSIGFVDWSIAMESGLPIARLRNAAGQFVAPSDESIGVAIAAATPVTAEHGTTWEPSFTTTDARAYPLPRVQYVVAPTTDIAIEKSRALHAFLDYAISEGQSLAPGAEVLPYGYVALPDPMAAAAKAAVALIPVEAAAGTTTTTAGGGGGSGTTTTTAGSGATSTTVPTGTTTSSVVGAGSGAWGDGGEWGSADAWGDTGFGFDTGFGSSSGGFDTSFGGTGDAGGSASGGSTSTGSDGTIDTVGEIIAEPVRFAQQILGSPTALPVVLVGLVGALSLLAGPAMQIAARRAPDGKAAAKRSLRLRLPRRRP